MEPRVKCDGQAPACPEGSERVKESRQRGHTPGPQGGRPVRAHPAPGLADLVQEMPSFPAWPRSRRPLARFSSAMGHSALGARAPSWLLTSTQQGAAGKARIWRRSFLRAVTPSFHLQGTAVSTGRVPRPPRGQTHDPLQHHSRGEHAFRQHVQCFSATVLKLRVRIKTPEKKGLKTNKKSGLGRPDSKRVVRAPRQSQRVPSGPWRPVGRYRFTCQARASSDPAIATARSLAPDTGALSVPGRPGEPPPRLGRRRAEHRAACSPLSRARQAARRAAGRAAGAHMGSCPPGREAASLERALTARRSFSRGRHRPEHDCELSRHATHATHADQRLRRHVLPPGETRRL